MPLQNGRNYGGLPLAGLALVAWAVAGAAPFGPQSKWPRVAGLVGVAILAIGWLWARVAIWFWQARLGYTSIGISADGAWYEFWGLTIPQNVTGTCLAAYTISVILISAVNRRIDLAIGSIGLACILGFLYIFGFALLGFDAFN